MNLSFSETEVALAAACKDILGRRAGPARARELDGKMDHELAAMLGQVGYLDLALEESAGPLAASLVTEWCAEAAVVYPIGVRTMVLPHLFAADDSMPTTAAVYSAGSSPLVRYALDAESLVVLDGDRVAVLRKGQWQATSVASRYGYPVARIEIRDLVGAVTTPGGEVIRLWWLLANVAEIIGTAQAALDLTIKYMGERVQFGKRISDFQALRHRIALCVSRLEGARWLLREVASLDVSGSAVASTAVAAYTAAEAVVVETHQMTGAIGFTYEHDLHLWTMRLQWLRVEAGGLREYANILANARWLTNERH